MGGSDSEATWATASIFQPPLATNADFVSGRDALDAQGAWQECDKESVGYDILL